jgi:hypothetical protein
MGRTPDKIRFHKGEIVEVFFTPFGNEVELGIVVSEPPSVEWAQQLRERRKLRKSPFCEMDSSDDCYTVLSGDCWRGKENTRYSLYDFKPGDDSDFHFHPECVYLFPPRFPVSDKLRETLQAALRDYCNE